jgi:hypothetical protein
MDSSSKSQDASDFALPASAALDRLIERDAVEGAVSAMSSGSISSGEAERFRFSPFTARRAAQRAPFTVWAWAWTALAPCRCVRHGCGFIMKLFYRFRAL